MNGKPDIKVGTLALWIHGRQFEDAHDYWDGNWLRATAHCGASGAHVEVSGPFLTNRELFDWAAECRELLGGTRRKAELATIEPELKVSLEAVDSLGHIAMVVDITPNHSQQEHRFHFVIDQSFLPGLIDAIERLEAKFPVRGRSNPAT